MRGFLQVLNVTLISPQGTDTQQSEASPNGGGGAGWPLRPRDATRKGESEEVCIRSKRTHMTPSRLVEPVQTYHAEPDKLHYFPRS